MWWDPDSVGSWVAFSIGIACWLTTVALVVWAILRVASNRREGNRGGDKPLEIAQQRLARGEITKEQFEDLGKALK